MTDNKQISLQTESALPSEQSSKPADLLSIAVKSGADMATMKELMDLQERWEKNEARKAYVTAMANFRAKCPPIAKTRKAHNSMYAGLAETVEAIKDVMSNCGLSHSWRTDQDNGLIKVTCCVTHILGHSECTTLFGEADTTGSKNKIQAIASTVSYLERYTLYAILGLASQDMDSDGGLPEQYINDEQVALLETLASEYGVDMEKFLKWLNISTLDDLPVKRFKQAKEALERKRK